MAGRRVLVIGSGGREHALVQRLAREEGVAALFALPGNAGMREAACLPGDPMDNAATVRTALEHRIDFCIVTPDDPLAGGLVDALEAAGVACFGPTRAAAQIESSKAFAKELMRRHSIPTADYAIFTDFESACAYVQGRSCPLVIKADGLARGKGVLIARDEAEARSALRSALQEHAFGRSGDRVIIEEYLEGPEVSVLTLCDGERLIAFPSAMDHKRALAGDQGPNTGGMGVIAPNPWYDGRTAARCMREIFLPTLGAMRQEGLPFRGCLYFGLMLTADGPKVLEYNARFGDPETQALLSLLEGPLLPALVHAREGRLSPDDLRFTDESACCLVFASGGYPGAFETGFPIEVGPLSARVDYAGVKAGEKGLVTAGGRVLSLTATAPTLRQAIDSAYRQAAAVRFQGAYLRPDIGRRALDKEEA